jgi:cytoskeletal protein CcmA (bactofilin family)
MADINNTPTGETPNEPNSLETLEDQGGTPESSDGSRPEANMEIPGEGLEPEASAPKANKTPAKKSKSLKKLRQRFNILILMFGFIVVVALGIILVAYSQSKKSSSNNIQTQSLSQSTLEQLANNDATVGSSKSILNVQSSAVFAGQVLVKQNLEVAGNLQIGGTVALSNIAVSGTSQLGQVTISKNLAVTGDTAIQGSSTIAKSLQVNGNGSFGGTLTAPQIVTPSLQLNGDLVLTHHINIGGGTPNRSGGSALGSGGSVSVSGSDTAGSTTINTGGGPAAGCFVTITFTNQFAVTPYILVTPIGSSAGGLSYYVNASTTGFSICDASPPPPGASFGFDYFVVG